VQPTVWHELSKYDVAKVYGADPDRGNVERVLEIVIESIPK
jgi:hypothetical protein